MNILLFIILIQSTVHVACDTLLGASITSNRTLTQTESPYLAEDNIVIGESSTLTLEAGVEIRFSPGIGLDVYGVLDSQGTEANPVILTTVAEDRNITYNESETKVRLVDGESVDRGILEIESSGAWSRPCDSRMSYLDTNSYVDWRNNLAKVVCAQLGFVHYEGANLQKTNQQDLNLHYSGRYTCDGNEERLSDCSISGAYCYVSQEIYVVCVSVLPGYHWAGVVIRNQVSAEKSTLANTVIQHAGVRSNHTHNYHYLRAALSGRIGIPQISNLHILDSAHHGLEVEQFADRVVMTDINVTGSQHHGIVISGTGILPVELFNVTTQGNLGNGLHFTGKSINTWNTRADIEFQDFCEIQCIRCDLDPDAFPLYFSFSANQQSCQTAFSTASDEVLLLRVLESPDYLQLKVNDGSLIDSPTIWDSILGSSQWAFPTPPIISESNTLNIQITSTSRSSGTLKLMIMSAPKGDFGLKIKDYDFSYNLGSGIFIEDWGMPVDIQQGSTVNNSIGISMKDSSTNLAISEASSNLNVQYGFAFDDSDGYFSLQDSILESNAESGIYIYHDRSCSSSYVNTRVAENMSIKNVKVMSNTVDGIKLKSNCRFNLSIMSTELSSNQYAVNLLLNGDVQLSNLFKVTGSLVQNNYFGLYMSSRGIFNIAIENNTFSQNKGPAFFDECNNYCSYGYGYYGSISIVDNTFLDNTVTDSSVLSLSNAETDLPVTISGNLFENNTVAKEILYYRYAEFDVGAVIKLDVNTHVDLRFNFFSNADSNFDMAYSSDSQSTVDARFCYWGSNEINYIQSRTFTANPNINLDDLDADIILVHPYLNSRDTSDFDINLPRYGDFIREQFELGGIIYSNYNLSDTSIIYQVTSDILIPEGSSLTIHPGVEVHFRWGVSIQVYGELQILGEDDAHVTLTAAHTFDNSYFQYMDGLPNGIVTVKRDSEWVPICNSGISSNTLNFICRAIGHRGYTSYSYTYSTSLNANTSLAYTNFNCPGTRYGSCTYEEIEQCGNNQFLEIVCSVNYWSGIYLSLHAAKSTFTYVDFQYTSSDLNSKTTQSAIDIDYYHHIIEHVNISYIFPDYGSSRAITIRKFMPDGRLSNIYISSNDYGIVNYDNHLIIHNTTLLSDTGDYGIYIQSQMIEFTRLNFSKIGHICEFNTSNYELGNTEHLLFYVNDSNHYNERCDLRVSSSPGKRIWVQEIRRYSPNCNNLNIYDGETEEVNLFPKIGSRSGDIWISSGNDINLVKEDDYCSLSVLLLIKETTLTNDQLIDSSSITSVTASGFTQNAGMYLSYASASISACYFSNNNIGIQLENLIANVETQDVYLEKNTYGIYINAYEHAIHIANATFKENDIGVYSRLSTRYQYTFINTNVFNSIFEDNSIAVKVEYCYSAWSLSVVKSVFTSNTKITELSCYDGYNYYNREGFLAFANNTVELNENGITFASFSSLQRWSIQNNSFIQNKQTVLQLYGYGVVDGNRFLNNTGSNANHMIWIQSNGNELQLSGNYLLDNTYLIGLVYTELSSANVLIEYNILEQNYISHLGKLWTMQLSQENEISTDFIYISNNTIYNNLQSSSESDCVSTALYITGVTKAILHFNVFNNPNFEYEATVNLQSPNRSSSLDMKYNYWGSTHANQIAARITSSNAVELLPVAFSPFFTTLELLQLDESFPDPPTIIRNTLVGRISQSIELISGTEYFTSGDVLIEPGVTILIGGNVTLNLKPQSTLFISGTMLIRGSATNPVYINTNADTRRTQDLSCGDVRLTDGYASSQRLEILINGTYMSICNDRWTNNNGIVACRNLGLGQPVLTRTRTPNEFDSRLQFACDGSEESLLQCSYVPLENNCNYYYYVYIACSDLPEKASIVFESSITEDVSVIQNVIFGNISKLQISGLPPDIEHIAMHQTDNGIIYIGNGIANERDINLKDFIIDQSENNGLSFYNVTSNVTIVQAHLSNIQSNGIGLLPSSSSSLLLASAALSSFRFCDAEIQLQVLPGHEYRYFGEETGTRTGCVRVFQTVENYVISLEIKVTSSSYNSEVVAEVFDGVTSDPSSLLTTISISRYNSPLVVTIKSVSYAMSIRLPGTVPIVFAAVSSVKKAGNDCNFENGLCGWRNYADIFEGFRGQWFLYDCSSQEYGSYGAQARDLNFPETTDGHYIMAGDNSTAACYYYYNNLRSKEAIFESADIDSTNNICSVTFSYFRNDGSYRGETLTLYMNMEDSVERLWMDTSDRAWTKMTVALDLSDLNGSFSLLFHAQYIEGCVNSVGIDDIIFNPCPEEKYVSTIRIVDSALDSIAMSPIYIWNSDPEKHNIIWIERVSVQSSGHDLSDDLSLIHIDAKSAYVLVRNTDIKNSNGQSLYVRFDSITDNRVSEASIVQNSFTYGTSGGVIYMENIGVNTAAFWVLSNTIMHNIASDSVIGVQIINASSEIEGNFIYNNTMAKIMEIGREGLNTTLQQICINNIFWFNTPQAIDARHTISILVRFLQFHDNVLNNPSADYELSTSLQGEEIHSSNGSYNLNCTYNWWGTGEISAALVKIKDGRITEGFLDAVILPLSVSPAASFGLSSSCALGWQPVGTYCYFYNVGAVTVQQAISTCSNQGALVMFQDTIDFDYTKKVTKYRDTDGSYKYAAVWLNTVNNDINQAVSSCRTFKIEDVGTAAYSLSETENCNELHPFICQRFTVVLCKNACFQRGACLGETCLCNDGWEGNDCSIFHCRDVNNCNNGKCVGPNQCSCDPGWVGRACSSSHCPRYSNCNLCTAKLGCGWCDSTRQCLPGISDNSQVTNCTAWFYYNCMTVDKSNTCSDQIKPIACSSRYCFEKNTNTDPGLCQQCRDLEACFQNTSDCYTWDESACPKGSVVSDYNDISRVDNTVFKKNVKVINPEENTMYYCPYKLSADLNDLRNLFITRDKINFGLYDVIVSAQSGGILHTVQQIETRDGFSYIIAEEAGLTNIIEYADFSKHSNLKDLTSPLATKDDVDSEVLYQIIVDEVEIEETVHIFDDTAVIYKCAGHIYSDNDNLYGQTYFLVISKQSVADGLDINEGDVIGANNTDGYLETVIASYPTLVGEFVQTNLTHCTTSNIDNLDFNLPDAVPMSCFGGDGWPGLHYFEDSLSNVPTVGQNIPGRRSDSALGKVTSVVDKVDFLFIEVVTIENVYNGSVVTSGNHSEFLPTRRRTTRSISQFIERFAKNLNFDISSSGTLSFATDVSFTATIDVMIKATWNWKKLGVDWDFGVTFGASFSFGCTATYRVTGTASVSDADGPKDLIKPKKFPAFYILIANVPVAGIATFEVKYSWSATASGTLEVSVGGSVNAAISKGFATSGLPRPDDLLSGGASTHWSAHLEDVSLTGQVTITPQFVAKWPRVLANIVTEGVIVPEKLTADIGIITVDVGTVSDIAWYLTATFGSPFIVKVFAVGCDTKCTDPLKPLTLGLTLGFQNVFVSIGGFGLEATVTAATPFLMKTFSDCFKQDHFDCCLCEETGLPGKWDAEHDKCLCECCCDPAGGPVDDTCQLKSTEDHTEECQCELCPDDSLKRWSAEIKCPCTCADGVEKEMEEDGTCDCDCLCSDGVTLDVIDTDGDCPCECECLNCDTSTIGANGCICPDDSCPQCEDGSQAERVNCQCKCPDPFCGVPPLCAQGRTGNNCDQPDCPSCQSCSGNGVCTASSGSCASSCQCGRQWRGACCENRVPQRTSGDPHLETLDGIAFDFFGIGEFMQCKSETNDFGCEVRFFYYGQASLTGALALKAVDSVVTITTDSPANETDMPNVRLNGELLDISSTYSEVLHDTVQMTLQPKSDTDEGNTNLLLASFQFNSGASLTVDVLYSPMMQRQFLNVEFIPTASFKYNTSGLCGYMDDDDGSNDLTGPDGVIYAVNNTDEFAESWRIVPMSREAGGMLNSWSWTESNFHINDTVDSTYNDPNFTPVYSIDGFTQVQVDEATSTCSATGIEGNLLDGCITDVLISGDLTMAEQGTLQIGCPNQCSSKGRCLNSTCTCIEGWTGDDCSVGACGTCFNGECQSGFCQCFTGWDGSACNVTATCYNVNNCTDASHGVCHRIDQCDCVNGFIGADCSIAATCYNVYNCSGNGVCVDTDVCSCSSGYTGSDCATFSCESINYCSSNGQCIGFDSCLCNSGWTGSSCSTPDCTSVNTCSGNGECTAPNTCTCVNGFTGSDCSTLASCPLLQDCSSNGVCSTQEVTVNNVMETTTVCSCDTGFSGDVCTAADCESLNNCSSHGVCTAPDFCECESGYGGTDCSQFTCDTINRCSAHGECVTFEVCNCDSGWISDDCSEANCTSVNECSSQGVCNIPDVCDCYDGYQGLTCSERSPDNLANPIFTHSLYEVTISEDESVPKYLIQVNATDSDTGQNGELRYSIDPSGLSINTGEYLLIDSISGEIQLIKAIPRTVVPGGNLSITVVAVDRGVPSKQNTTELLITILDVNSCPSITYPTAGSIVYLNESSVAGTDILTITATDADFEANSELLYGVDALSSQLVSVDANSGMITLVNSNPAVEESQITISVKDQGSYPCTFTSSFRLQVIPASIVAPSDPVESVADTTAAVNVITNAAAQTTASGNQQIITTVVLVQPTTHREDVVTTAVPAQPTTHREDVVTTAVPAQPTTHMEDAVTTAIPAQLTTHREDVVTTTVPTQPTIHREDVVTTAIPAHPTIHREGVVTTTVPAQPTIHREDAVTTAIPAQPTIHREGVVTTTVPAQPTIHREDAVTTAIPAQPTIHREGVVTTAIPAQPTTHMEDAVTTAIPAQLTTHREDVVTTAIPAQPTIHREDVVTTAVPPGDTTAISSSSAPGTVQTGLSTSEISLVAVGMVLGVLVVTAVSITAVLAVKYSQAQKLNVKYRLENEQGRERGQYPRRGYRMWPWY